MHCMLDWPQVTKLMNNCDPKTTLSNVHAPGELSNECVAWSRKLGSQFRVSMPEGEGGEGAGS